MFIYLQVLLGLRPGIVINLTKAGKSFKKDNKGYKRQKEKKFYKDFDASLVRGEILQVGFKKAKKSSRTTIQTIDSENLFPLKNLCLNSVDYTNENLKISEDENEFLVVVSFSINQ